MPSCIRAPPAAENRTRPAHKAKVLGRGDDGRAANLALRNKHRIRLAGRLLRGFHPVGITLLVAKVQRIGGRLWHLDFGKNATIEKGRKAITRSNRHMMIARRADI